MNTLTDTEQLDQAMSLLKRLRRENVVWSGTGTTKLARDVDAFLFEVRLKQVDTK